MKANTEKPGIPFLRFVAALAGSLLGGPGAVCGKQESGSDAARSVTCPAYALFLLAVIGL